MAKAKSLSYLDAQVPNRISASIILQTRLNELYSWEPYVNDPERVQELHNLRIAAKRLRYTLEMFANILPDEHTQLLKEAEQIQEELGALHDSDTMIALLQFCLEHYDNLERGEERSQDIPMDVQPALISHLTRAETMPSKQQRQGLDQYRERLQRERQEQYQTFLQHWQKLQEQGYRQAIESLLK